MAETEKSEKTLIRAAIFGAGKMAMHHIKAISLHNNARVVAVADPAMDEKKLKSFLPENIAIYSNPEDLLRNIHPDVVHICTPPETHTTLATLALKSGAHIYVEKPFSLSSKEATNVISLANSLKLKVCSGHQLLFEPQMLKVNDQLNKIGMIIHVESYFSFNTVRRSKEGRTVILPLEQLIDILPHPVYLLLYFLKINKIYSENILVDTYSLNIRTDGNVHGIFCCGETTGVLVVTLKGRPIESYIKVVGTNGSIYVEFVRGTFVMHLGPGTSGISKIINPYSNAWQILIRTSTSLFKRVLKKQKSYPGLYEIIFAFYKTFENEKETILGGSSIIETVTICEEIGKRLKTLDTDENRLAAARLSRIELNMSKPELGRGGVLVTGGTGMLGLEVTKELKKYKWDVWVLSRKEQPYSLRIPGVKYLTADLGESVSSDMLHGISIVVHCAAETAGGKEAHERNTINATRNILHAMASAGINKFIHISSIAVLKSSRDIKHPIDENTGLVLQPDERGPYVWGKSEAERLVGKLCENFGIEYRIIRPGPLVDYNSFAAPGRLGREVGRIYIYIGHKNNKISLCSVQTAAEIIHMYVEKFDSMPPILNLIEPNSPTRGELISLLLKNRPDLRAFRIPAAFFWVISSAAKLLQLVLRPNRKPLDIYAAFASEKYNSELAADIIEKSKVTCDMNLHNN